MRYFLFILFTASILYACKKDKQDENTKPEELNLTYIYIGDAALSITNDNKNLSIDELIEIRFDKPINPTTANNAIKLIDSDNQDITVTLAFFDQNKLLKIDHPLLKENNLYTLSISDDLKGAQNETFTKQTYTFTTTTLPLVLEKIWIDGEQINPLVTQIDVDRIPTIKFGFNTPLAQSDLKDFSTFSSNGAMLNYNLNQDDDLTISFSVTQELEDYQKFQFTISSQIQKRIGKPFDGLELNFFTQLDSSLKFPVISDEELLTKVQQQTFKYFWDFAHPVSGLSRERSTGGDLVTIGGSGFGVMTIPVGIERGFISRADGVARLAKIVDFLAKADRFHGVWPHWMDGATGLTRPFSTKDNGGDIVETAFMIQGLLTVKQYLNPGNPTENTIISKINALWEAVEWDWYTQGENSITWHWSPEYGFEKNLKVRGWNESLIVYVLAASSPTHPITKEVYDQGWARNGNMKNGKSFYDIILPLGNDYGGPMFFEHYPFLGLDPRNLSDSYANYWEQAQAHTLINRGYCMANPKAFVGYSGDCWGLTASDNHEGYSAHSPTNDKGVITPTAALSSMPYTPEESMAALKHFYYLLGDRLWGEYGFYDAFSISNSWVASSYLAIDQGPIILMIENHRTGMLWNLFMQDTDVQQGLTKLGFNY
ncbi:hypothetical protein SAMN06265379_102396 [Saccharicrinis carchari]|uniref:Glycoamylase-like domain-containing protein n=1 Tax=Saccharicrinis carchari TaxID=1168039 RepID=A0A521C4U0_SACCC|nr:glucoamylase family protein [Saccharicrinis carchari]SMO54413.1 hypothetical protein SAMN06265379_102396 [Saccharicrinis carchari]